MHVKDVSKEQFALLASIFHHPVPESWAQYAERCYCIEPQLDRHLLRPDFLHRLVQLPQSHYAPLCKLHKIFNAKIVHEVFVLVATEVGVRLNSLVVAGRDRVGHETWDRSILNLRSLHGAWLHPEIFWDTFGKTLDVPKSGYASDDYMIKWLHEEDGCEACILKRIGGDLDTVFDLQMVVKSRIHTRSARKYRDPRLMKLIDGWLKLWQPHYGPNEWQEKLKWNGLRADRLKEARRVIAKAKRRGKTEHAKGVAPSRRHQKPKISTPITTHEQQRTDSNRLAETVKVHHPSDVNKSTDSGDEDDDDVVVQATIQDAENELIDCYAALLSTPFLPGMDDEQHQRRASTLSHRYSTISSLDGNTGWPTVKNASGQQGLARSQSAKYRRPSNYSESVYSQGTTTLPTRVHGSSVQQSKSSSTLKRSNTVQEKRNSGQSWVTESVPPSVATTEASSSKIKPVGRSNKHEGRFEPIVEEVPTLRHASSQHRHRPVSPLYGDEYGAKDKGKGRATGRHSPVSPLSPTVSSSSKFEGSRHAHMYRDTKDSSPKWHTADQYLSRSKSHASSSRSRDYTSSPTPKISSRLSKPFDGPATEPASVLNSARQLRDRESIMSDMTYWSALYGADYDRIRRTEEGYQRPHPEFDSGSERKDKDRRR